MKGQNQSSLRTAKGLNLLQHGLDVAQMPKRPRNNNKVEGLTLIPSPIG